MTDSKKNFEDAKRKIAPYVCMFVCIVAYANTQDIKLSHCIVVSLVVDDFPLIVFHQYHLLLCTIHNVGVRI